MMQTLPAFENDFRCEFDLPKFTDLRQTMVTRSQQRANQALLAGRETMASSITTKSKEEDANLAWF